MSDSDKTSQVEQLLLDPERGKPEFIDHARPDQLVDAVMRLAMEVSMLRDRLDVHEALAERHGYGGADAVDAYVLSAETLEKQARRRARWVQRIVHDLTT